MVAPQREPPRFLKPIASYSLPPQIAIQQEIGPLVVGFYLVSTLEKDSHSPG